VTIADEKYLFLRDWAAANKCALEDKGEVGFGRPCVGIMYGSSYVDWDYATMPSRSVPVDAYHKHDCLAVLVHGDDYDAALEQLYTWVVAINEANMKVEVGARKTHNAPGTPGAVIELMLGGASQPRLVPA
jgi:hypothetical protein